MHEAELHAAYAKITTAAPHLRLVDETTSASKAFRTKDDATSYAMVFYSFPPDPSIKPPTKALEAATKANAPSGWTSGVTGEDVLQAGTSDSNGPGVLAETLIGGVGALLVLAFVFASFLALLPLLVAVASILFTFLMLLPITYALHVSVIVQFLVSLISLAVSLVSSLLLWPRCRAVCST